LEINLDYSIASEISGTVLAYVTEFNPDWKPSDIEANTTKASNLNVFLSSGDYEFTTSTDSDGNFSITVPGDLEYVLKAFTTGSTYGVGLSVNPDGQSEFNAGDIFLNQLFSVSGTLLVNDANNTWNGQFYDGLTPIVVATDDDGIEWESEVNSLGAFSFNLKSGEYDFNSKSVEYNITPLNNWNVSQFIDSQNINLTSNLELISINVSVCLTADEEAGCDQVIAKYAEVTFNPITSNIKPY
jgi:hypothetical protein